MNQGNQGKNQAEKKEKEKENEVLCGIFGHHLMIND